ncbi:MAG: phosphodiester glycosidase family protein [Alteraurantiacibacter sp.]
MRRASLAALAALTLSACELHFEGETDETLASICEPVIFEDSPLTHCIAVPGEQSIAMALAPEGSDTPYRTLRDYSRAASSETVMAMNGGMYDGEGLPIGYYVEDGRRLTVLNQNDGPGNFHLLPNGVFYGETEQGPWRVRDTERFADEVVERPAFATQSGPMLVIRGELHPAIDPDGDSHKTRNAVGVDAAGRAHFVITEAPVSFGRLARYYRDVLNVDNALFLDGSVSQLWDPPRDRLDTGPDIGPIVVVRQMESK